MPELALRAGLTLLCGLVLQGRLDEATLLESELVEAGYEPDEPWLMSPRSLPLLAQRDLAAALPRYRMRIALLGSIAALPRAKEVLIHIEVLVGNALVDEALTLARHYMTAFEKSDGPLAYGSLASAAYVALAGPDGQAWRPTRTCSRELTPWWSTRRQACRPRHIAAGRASTY